FFGHLIFRNLEQAAAGAQPVGCPHHKIVIRPHLDSKGPLLKSDSDFLDAALDQIAHYVWVVNLFVHFVASVNKIEIHPLRAAEIAHQAVSGHYFLEQIRRRPRAFMRNCVVMAAVSHDSGGERGGELSASFERLSDGLRTSRIVIPGVNAKLIDCGCAAQDTQRVEEPHVVALLREPNRYRRSVNSRAGDRNFCPHDCAEATARLAETSFPSRTK